MLEVKNRVAAAVVIVGQVIANQNNLNDFVGYRSDDPLLEMKQFSKRYEYLGKVVPGLAQWPAFHKLQLASILQIGYGIPLGVCQYLSMLSQKLICFSHGIKMECECALPRPIICHFQMDSNMVIPSVSQFTAERDLKIKQIIAGLLKR